jgi:hypothetical protein
LRSRTAGIDLPQHIFRKTTQLYAENRSDGVAFLKRFFTNGILGERGKKNGNLKCTEMLFCKNIEYICTHHRKGYYRSTQ